MITPATISQHAVWAADAMDNEQRKLDAARAALIDAVSAKRGSHILASRLEAVAKAEGALETYAHIALVAGRLGQTTADLVVALAQYGLRDPDDTWSGRGNDVRRARHDGVLCASNAMLDQIRYGS